MDDNLIMWLVTLIPFINVFMWCTFIQYLSWKSVRDEIDALDTVAFAFCCILSCIAIPILISRDIAKRVKKRNIRKRMEGPTRIWMTNKNNPMWFIITQHGKCFGIRFQSMSTAIIIHMYPIQELQCEHKLATLQEKHRCIALLRAFLKMPDKRVTYFKINGKTEMGITAKHNKNI